LEVIADNLSEFFLLLGLLCLSAFFSGSETALFSLSPQRLRSFREKGGRPQRLIASLLDTPHILLATVLFCNMLVNVLFFAVASGVVFYVDEAVGHGAALFAGIFFLLLLIIGGEVTPKAVAERKSLAISRYAAFPLYLLQKVLFPVHFLLGFLLRRLSYFFEARAAGPFVTDEELKMLVDLSQTQGVIAPGEGEMMQEVLDLDEVKVRDIMVPRVDVALYNASGGVEGLIELARKTKHTKLPIYDRTIDEIMGIVYVKEVMLSPGKMLKDFIRKVSFVPETKSAESLLRDFRHGKTSIAVVVNEYGGLEGIITLEDILEEIVGEIEDEYDAARKIPQPVIRRGPHRYELSANIGIREWQEIFGIELVQPAVATLGGFVISLLGRLPRVGDVVGYGNLTFTVLEVRRRRIARLLLEVAPRDDETSGAKSAAKEKT
jgi:CBS domain containing-hemolysin-like protein